MKKIIYLIAIIAVLISSCKKEEVKLAPMASINVTNVVVGGTTAKMVNSTLTISNNSYMQIPFKAGSGSLYVYPLTDSLHPYYNNSITTNKGEVYSLFLTGTPAAPDAVVIKENIPHRTDSTAGIRFINLAPTSNPLNITLSTTPTVNEVNTLVYKQNTGFKNYPGLYNSTYIFQVRDAATAAPANPLATFSLTTSTVPRFANITLVIRQSGTGVAVFRVNNDR